MKLTNQDIQFIDKYLEESGVKYADIRHEMTDHVATALEGMEGSFYDSFKSYMLRHKKELLKSNNKFTKAAGRRAMKMMLRNFLKPLTIVISVVVFYGLSQILYNYVGEEQLVEIYSSGYLLFGLLILLYYRYFYGASRHKYSVVDKLQSFFPISLYVVFVFIKPDRIIDNSFILVGFYSFFTSFMITNIITFKELTDKYKLQYND